MKTNDQEAPVIKKYCNHHGYTDIDPYEVVKEISDHIVEIRPMDAEKDDSVKLKFQIGGFSAHCSNQSDQKWHINSVPDADTIKVVWDASQNKWINGSCQFIMSDTPIKFYDYNF